MRFTGPRKNRHYRSDRRGTAKPDRRHESYSGHERRGQSPYSEYESRGQTPYTEYEDGDYTEYYDEGRTEYSDIENGKRTPYSEYVTEYTYDSQDDTRNPSNIGRGQFRTPLNGTFLKYSSGDEDSRSSYSGSYSESEYSQLCDANIDANCMNTLFNRNVNGKKVPGLIHCNRSEHSGEVQLKMTLPLPLHFMDHIVPSKNCNDADQVLPQAYKALFESPSVMSRSTEDEDEYDIERAYDQIRYQGRKNLQTSRESAKDQRLKSLPSQIEITDQPSEVSSADSVGRANARGRSIYARRQQGDSLKIDANFKKSSYQEHTSPRQWSSPKSQVQSPRSSHGLERIANKQALSPRSQYTRESGFERQSAHAHPKRANDILKSGPRSSWLTGRKEQLDLVQEEETSSDAREAPPQKAAAALANDPYKNSANSIPYVVSYAGGQTEYSDITSDLPNPGGQAKSESDSRVGIDDENKYSQSTFISRSEKKKAEILEDRWDRETRLRKSKSPLNSARKIESSSDRLRKSSLKPSQKSASDELMETTRPSKEGDELIDRSVRQKNEPTANSSDEDVLQSTQTKDSWEPETNTSDAAESKSKDILPPTNTSALKKESTGGLLSLYPETFSDYCKELTKEGNNGNEKKKAFKANLNTKYADVALVTASTAMTMDTPFTSDTPLEADPTLNLTGTFDPDSRSKCMVFTSVGLPLESKNKYPTTIESFYIFVINETKKFLIEIIIISFAWVRHFSIGGHKRRINDGVKVGMILPKLDDQELIRAQTVQSRPLSFRRLPSLTVNNPGMYEKIFIPDVHTALPIHKVCLPSKRRTIWSGASSRKEAKVQTINWETKRTWSDKYDQYEELGFWN